MKTKTISILAAVTLLSGAIQPVQAADKETYLIGGLLGGWILNNVFDHSPHHRPVEIHTRRQSCRPPVVVERHDYHHGHSRPTGRYEVRQVKDWVSGRYECVRTRCGRVERRWVPGHYTYRTKKVWVSYGSSYSRGHCRSRNGRH